MATINDLPIEVQNELYAKRAELSKKWHVNTAYEIRFTNAEGTRYFYARRVCVPWHDNKGHYMNYGGGTYWTVSYGVIKAKKEYHAMGYTYEWHESAQRFTKSANGTEIPNQVATKKEVLEIAKKIGTLVM